MKVYVLESHWGYGDKELEGIYSNRANAEEAELQLREAQRRPGWDYCPVDIEITEIEVDGEPLYGRMIV